MFNSGALGLRDVAIGLLVAGYGGKYLGKASLPIGLAALIAGKYNNSGLLSAIGLALAVSDAANLFRSSDDKKEESPAPSKESMGPRAKEHVSSEKPDRLKDATVPTGSRAEAGEQRAGTGEKEPCPTEKGSGHGSNLSGGDREEKADEDRSFEEMLDDLEGGIATVPKEGGRDVYEGHFYSEQREGPPRRRKRGNKVENNGFPAPESVERKGAPEDPMLFEDSLEEMLV